jgi:hypothetical protein
MLECNRAAASTPPLGALQFRRNENSSHTCSSSNGSAAHRSSGPRRTLEGNRSSEIYAFGRRASPGKTITRQHEVLCDVRTRIGTGARALRRQECVYPHGRLRMLRA